jgi:trigger factor
MKSSVENLTSLQRRLHIEIPAATVESTFQKHFSNIQKNVQLKGFRKGKAPLSAVRSMYGDRVKSDVVQDLIQNHYVQALTTHKLDPIGNPEFEFADPIDGVDFKFSAEFDVRPEVTLKKYEGLEVEKEKLEFDDKRIDAVLDNVRAKNATLVDVLEDRPAQMGDTAVIDFDGSVDGKPLDGGKGTDHQLELGAKQFIEGFEEGVVGMKIGAETTLNLKFPTPYHSADLEGKAVEFKVVLKGLKKKEMPELTDDFIKSIGGDQDLAGLKNTIKNDMIESDKKRIDEAFKNRLVKKLAEENPIEVPPRLMEEQKLALIEDFKKRMQNQGMTPADFEQYIQKWDADFAKSAKEMIQSSFLIDAIARKHNLAATLEEVNKKLADYAAQSGIELQKVKEFYEKPEQLNRLTYSLTEEKVIDLLMSTAKVKEVEASKLKDKE